MKFWLPFLHIYGKVLFKNEFHQRLKFNRRGLVGMASGNDGMNGSQFFFTLNATPDLDKKHTLFGKVCSISFVYAKLNISTFGNQLEKGENCKMEWNV